MAIFKYRYLLWLAAVSAPASVITVSTPAGGSVSAQATFTTGPGTLMVTLTNLEGDIHAAGQLLSDLQFSVAGLTSGFSLVSSSAPQITLLAGGGTVTGPAGSTGWGLGDAAGAIELCEICPTGLLMLTPVTGGPPSHTLIGPGPFTSPNASLLNNHNPFLNQTATFTLDNEALREDSAITGVRFGFGTQAGTYVSGVPTVPSQVPEPATLALAGAGLLALGLSRRRVNRAFRRSPDKT